ncbi:MAG: hypothetical protein ACR2IH_08330 [Pyrinomonadaceae bacterium]
MNTCTSIDGLSEKSRRCGVGKETGGRFRVERAAGASGSAASPMFAPQAEA